MKYSRLIVFALIIATFLACSVFAETARDITCEVSIECKGIDKDKIFDNDLSTSSKGTDVEIFINAKECIGGLYIKYNNFSSVGMLNYETPVGRDGFIHEFVPCKGYESASLIFDAADICDIQVFSQGDLPKDVQVWQAGDQKTDILLCATHSDDDQLFFAGLLPYYAGVKKANVRVAYFINHFDTYNRTHELLDGLWECGVVNYPDISPFPDGYSESSDEALKFLESKGFTYDDILSFQKSLLEKYEPLVVVLHDFNGEYGHGAHILNTESFVSAFEDEESYKPEKVYVHLYEENPIVLNIDEPLYEFGGLSAFQVSQKAFGHHKSQHWTWFYEWIYGKNNSKTSSSQIRSYNPAFYGLYYSQVGEDIKKNCILENITLYRDREIVLPPIPDTDIDIPSKPLSNLPDVRDDASIGIFDTAVTLCIYALILIIAIIFIRIIKRKRDD